MSLSDSSAGPSNGARFETTHWSLVLKAGRGADDALLKLCRRYWMPLYVYTRRRGHGVHEAQDLTQGFFAHILEAHALSTAVPAKGRFRSFLLVSLKHFLDNQWHKEHALKRGGGKQLVSWDQLSIDERETLEPPEHVTPEKLFDRRWALTILERAMDQLGKECAVARKSELFASLKDYLAGDTGTKSYAEIAAELNMSEGAVKVSVFRMRKRFGELVRGQVERTVSSPEEIDDEIRELFEALG